MEPLRRKDRRRVERLHEWERLTRAATPALLGALSPARGERVVDVGCGPGTATLRAAEAVGPHGAVTGVDVFAPVVEFAARGAALAGLTNVSFQVADAQRDCLSGGPFTAAMSQFGVMFFTDPTAAFANVRGHLAPGGRFCFTCWQQADRNPWSFAATLADLLPPTASASGDPAPGPFSLADPGRVQRLLHHAGFADVEVVSHRITVDVPEGTVLDDTELALMGVTEERMHEARALVARQLGPHRLSGGLLRLPLAFLAVAAR
jgi:SAM-dependent methyltransferase